MSRMSFLRPILEWLIRQKQAYNVGHSWIPNFIDIIFPVGFFIEDGLISGIIVYILLSLFAWFWGYLWIHFKLYEYEQVYVTRLNKMFRDIHDKITNENKK